MALAEQGDELDSRRGERVGGGGRPAPEVGSETAGSSHRPWAQLHCARAAERRECGARWHEAGGVLHTIPVGKGIAGHCAASCVMINVPDAHSDARFDTSFDRATGSTIVDCTGLEA